MRNTVIIGGGPAGLMAAIYSAKNEDKVTIIEKMNSCGKKLLITGKGRCNITNNAQMDKFMANTPTNPKFLYGVFNNFTNKDIIELLESEGVKTKVERGERVFPVSDRAQDVLEALLHILKKENVQILTNTTAKRIITDAEKNVLGVELDDGKEIKADKIILATGGKSYPVTGSTGDGYRFAKEVGHTITELYPTEAPITSPEPFIKERVLKGLSLRNVALSVLNKKGKKVTNHQMDMIFTHFGVSGPAALRCSMFIHQTKKRDKADIVTMSLDVFPEQSLGQLQQDMQKLIKEHADKSVKNGWKDLMPERYLLFGLERLGIDPNQTLKSLNPKEIQAFAEFCKSFTFQADGTHPLDKAFVTGGGVSTKEVNPKTMESKLMPGLYFCGELLDYNGYTGGYNITGAFVTGHTSGYHAAIDD